jgi:predicted DNA binding CopG/RHH family protein
MRRRGIDFSDLPEMSDEQLRSMHRVGRLPSGGTALIAIRIAPQVLVALQREAKRPGVGYQSLIHQLLARHVARKRSA